MNLKDRIKAEYTKKGYSLAEFASSLNMSPSNLGNQISKNDTVQLGLIRKICQKLSISVGSLLESEIKHSTEEEQMILDQLKAILEGGQEETVDLIVGKITREYARISTKKESSLTKELLR